MPTYYFRISGTPPSFTEEGVYLPDDNRAWEEARSLIRDAEETLSPDDGWELDVLRDELPLFHISIHSAKLMRS
jgi:hypothetical protein